MTDLLDDFVPSTPGTGAATPPPAGMVPRTYTPAEAWCIVYQCGTAPGEVGRARGFVDLVAFKSVVTGGQKNTGTFIRVAQAVAWAQETFKYDEKELECFKQGWQDVFTRPAFNERVQQLGI